MKGKIVDNFSYGAEGHRTDPRFIKLCERISGKEVELVFTYRNAFEREDKNWWLPEKCWEEI